MRKSEFFPLLKEDFDNSEEEQNIETGIQNSMTNIKKGKFAYFSSFNKKFSILFRIIISSFHECFTSYLRRYKKIIMTEDIIED